MSSSRPPGSFTSNIDLPVRTAAPKNRQFTFILFPTLATFTRTDRRITVSFCSSKKCEHQRSSARLAEVCLGARIESAKVS